MVTAGHRRLRVPRSRLRSSARWPRTARCCAWPWTAWSTPSQALGRPNGPDRRLDGADHLAHDRAAARALRLRHRHAAQRERPRQPGAASLPGSSSCAARTSTSSTSRACSASPTTSRCRRSACARTSTSTGTRGDPTRNRINLLRAYDQSDIMERIKDMCSRPLPHGEVV